MLSVFYVCVCVVAAASACNLLHAPSTHTHTLQAQTVAHVTSPKARAARLLTVNALLTDQIIWRLNPCIMCLDVLFFIVWGTFS